MDRYKVWVQIERIGDESSDDYENITEQEDITEFETEQEARDFLDEVRAI